MHHSMNQSIETKDPSIGYSLHPTFIHRFQSKPNLSLFSPYYAKACNKLAVPISASQRQSNTATCVDVDGGEPFATLCKIWPTFGKQTLDLSAHEASALSIRPSRRYRL